MEDIMEDIMEVPKLSKNDKEKVRYRKMTYGPWFKHKCDHEANCDVLWEGDKGIIFTKASVKGNVKWKDELTFDYGFDPTYFPDDEDLDGLRSYKCGVC